MWCTEYIIYAIVQCLQCWSHSWSRDDERVPDNADGKYSSRTRTHRKIGRGETLSAQMPNYRLPSMSARIGCQNAAKKYGMWRRRRWSRWQWRYDRTNGWTSFRISCVAALTLGWIVNNLYVCDVGNAEQSAYYIGRAKGSCVCLPYANKCNNEIQFRLNVIRL